MCIPGKIISSYGLPLPDIALYRFITSFLLLFPCLFTLFAQPENKNYPVQFSLFTFSYPVINPASMGIRANTGIWMGYQKPVNGFTSVSTYFCNISFVPYKLRTSSKNKSVFGFRFFNDNEGAYINRMRLYGMYAFHTRLNDRLKISGGLDLGGMNFSVKPTPTTAGASAFKVDADAGIWLYNKDFHIGISINQLFNSKLQPLDEQTILATHVNLSGSVTLLRTGNMEITPHLLITTPYYSGASFRTCFDALFFDKFMASIGWKAKSSFSVMMGIKDMDISNNKLNIMVSYSASTRRSALAINYLEISIGCGR
jgi:type IX secretion system PorP/SprF family membrane protein